MLRRRHCLSEATIAWLLEGDPSIQYQVRRDLLAEAPAGLGTLQRRIAKEGWGAHFLSLQRPDGHWGRGYYQPKWTSTLQNRHPGAVHFDMEPPGRPSRWNTLRAARVLMNYGEEGKG